MTLENAVADIIEKEWDRLAHDIGIKALESNGDTPQSVASLICPYSMEEETRKSLQEFINKRAGGASLK